MPIYEYRCDSCRKRSSALLVSWSAPDPACPHCGSLSVRRLVSTFATQRSEDAGDFGDDFDDDGGYADEDGEGGDWEGGGTDDDF